MKTRIKVIENYKAEKEFSPQVRVGFKWHNIYKEEVKWRDGPRITFDEMSSSYQLYKTLDSCKSAIDEYIAYKANKKLVDTKKITFIKYP